MLEGDDEVFVPHPKRSQEEIEKDIEYFVNHPLNAR